MQCQARSAQQASYASSLILLKYKEPRSRGAEIRVAISERSKRVQTSLKLMQCQARSAQPRSVYVILDEASTAATPQCAISARFEHALAPAVGFEPTTNRLTADRSTTELRWNNCSFGYSKIIVIAGAMNRQLSTDS